MIHLNLQDKNEIKQIEKIFSIEFIGFSRLDGYPYFRVKNKNVDELKEYFKMEIVSLLEDQIPGFPAGQKDIFILKIVECNKHYIQHIRKEKLQHLEIIF
jgi:hypothetical protein